MYRYTVDVDLRSIPKEQITRACAHHCRSAVLVREDVFDRYPNGRVMQRIYFADATEADFIHALLLLHRPEGPLAEWDCIGSSPPRAPS